MLTSTLIASHLTAALVGSIITSALATWMINRRTARTYDEIAQMNALIERATPTNLDHALVAKCRDAVAKTFRQIDRLAPVEAAFAEFDEPDEDRRCRSDEYPSEREIQRSQSLIAAVLGPEEVVRLEAEADEIAEDLDHCRDCDRPRGSCRECQAEHAADQRDFD
jgi:hypothetical protein